MKKELLTTAALSCCLTMISGARAQTCVTPPSCEELGYIFSKEDCDGLRSLRCPFDSSKYFCGEAGDSAADAQPGMILYSDGTVSDSVISDKTPIGIVAYVDGSTRFAVALKETTAAWEGYNFDVSCLTDMNISQAQSDFNGAANTQCLIHDNQSHSAAEYCNTYKPVSNGTGSSGWYLPAAGELYAINLSYATVNLGLHKLSKTQLRSDSWYWSSSEHSKTGAWRIIMPNGDMAATTDKNNSYLVRCILAF